MSSRRMAFLALALATLGAFALPPPAAAAEVPMLRLLDAPSVAIPKELAASPKVVPIRLNLAALEEPRLRLPLPDGKVLRVERTDVERRGRRDYAWRGRTYDAKGQVDGFVTVTVFKNLMRARIVTPGRIWNIVNEGGRYWLAQHVGSDLPCGANGRSEVVPLVLKQALADKAEASGTVEAAGAAPEAAFNRIRLVVVYPRASTLGDANRLLLQIRAAVDDANTALANDSINARIDLVMTREVNHPESKDPVDDLIYLYEDPAMVALRRQANVSLISYISIQSNVCGIANLMDRNEFLGRTPALGVSLVRRSCLDDQTLLHELGHNFGAEHDPANANPPNEALLPYGFGHVVVPVFRTIMSYDTECGGSALCPRIDHFSNPRATFAGHPVGIENERDNARLVEATNFRFVTRTTPGVACRPGADRLCLLKKRFQVDVAWNNQFNGTSGNGRAVPRTDAAGFFSFGDPSNLELMVKLLDFGDTVKVFWGQLTNLRYQLTITDTKTGEARTYQNTPGDCGGIDQNAFPGGAALDAATLKPVGLATGKAAACRSSSKELCLDNRFAVSVDWRNPGNGAQGQGVAVPFSRVTGAFHFGQASNLELMAKVITQGDRIDFFWGALSDLEYTIHVTDSLTGQVKTYQNPAGKYCGGLEVDAF